MCEPTTIALAITAVSAAVSYQQQGQAAKRQSENIQRTNDLQQMDLARQHQQQTEAEAEQMNQANRQATQSKALFDAVAGEYGGGNTVDRTESIANVQANENLATMKRNADNASNENSFAQLATTSQANAKLSTINTPSLLGTALQIGGATANAYAQTHQPKKTGT